MVVMFFKLWMNIIGCQINNYGGVDSNGNEEWRQTYDGIYTSTSFIHQFEDELILNSVIRKLDDNGIDGGSSGSVTVDGGFIFTGTNSSNDFYTVKTDIEGNIEWSNSLSLILTSFGSSVLEVSNGGFIVCGFQDDGILNDLNRQLVIVRYDSR